MDASKGRSSRSGDLPPSGRAVGQRRREVLDHFGSCPECGYAAQTFIVTTYFADGAVRVTTVGCCGLTCGWSGPTTIAKMTEQSRS